VLFVATSVLETLDAVGPDGAVHHQVGLETGLDRCREWQVFDSVDGRVPRDRLVADFLQR